MEITSGTDGRAAFKAEGDYRGCRINTATDRNLLRNVLGRRLLFSVHPA
jgi:hypothetical protein